jgi:uncharacterized membrane protein (UPF0127 family)
MLHNAFKVYKKYKIITTPIKGKKYKLWVADTDQKKRIGLSAIDKLPKGWGMIFKYDKDTDGAFTMENTKVPLKIIFLDKDFGVVDYFNCRPFQKGSIYPRNGKKYRYVVEI